MQFTKLRLAGFKSFVESTEFLIEPGLTGIVGPNGCGKSNLVEALRWVMGENRVKQMRGGEMDDVIFAGTTSRPARNIAEVSLVIENQDRKAPAAYNDLTEIEIARRIERGQGSVYRIGGRDARARDVQLFFADIASGAHSPALVSQGRIGAIINAKPTERRALLEEAAGITGLHSRRHEAELKLKAAEANLARLDDVLRTLDTQYQGLKKQAKQAARYRNMSDLIRRAEAILYTLRWREATAARDAAAERLAAAERQVADITGRAAAVATELAESEAGLPALRKSEAEAAAALARLTIAREQLEAEEARVAAALTQAEARLAQLDADSARERNQAADAEAALRRVAVERQTLAAAEIEAADLARDTGAALNAQRVKVEEQDAAIARATESVAAAEAERATLRRTIDDLAQRIEKLRARLAAIEAERDTVAAATIEAARHESAEARLRAAEEALDQAAAAQEAAEAARRAAQEEERGAREALRAAEAELGRIDAERAGLAKILKAVGTGDLFAPVVDQIRAVPGYETALGAALGDDLTAPIDASAPMHWRLVDTLGEAPALPLGAEPLANFVTAPAALARRLSQIGVVADEESGAIVARGLQQGQRLVSRSGALWRWDGFTVKAGTPTAAATKLAQRNRLSELEQPRAEAAALVEAAQARFAAAVEAGRAAETQDAAAREAARKAHGELQAARDAQAALAREAAAQSAKLAGLVEQAERLAADLAEHIARQQASEEKFAQIPDPSAAREQLAGDRAALATERAAFAELQATMHRLEREADARHQRVQTLAQDETQWQARAASAQRQIEILTERIAQTTAERDELANRPAQIAAERDALFEKLQGAEQARNEASDALAEAENATAEAERRLKAIENELGTAREDRVREEATAAQVAQALDELAQRIRERLDCAPEETLAAGGLDADDELPELRQIEARLERLTKERDTMGPVNLRAEQEAAELEQQMSTLQSEKDDLVRAIARLRQGIASLNREGRDRLLGAFETVNKNFQDLFVKLFGGGRAHLSLATTLPPEAPDQPPREVDPLEAGLEVMASPPGKKLQTLSLLSGGEQALTALALLFAVFISNPAPICVLDEVDAPLDDANVDRFCTLLEHIGTTTGTRFIVVTHHRMTMARMDRLFGVTMAERGVSQLVSVDLAGAERMRATA
ncbi:MAG TPA: chromosome segregation protein SMC [Alphaproteobacteria bacterium]|nr:chromosome segregation protein SMC [Alphaproteobacteria bacterium]